MKVCFVSSKRAGFTLLEFVIYIGMTTMVLVSLLSFTWSILHNRAKQAALMEVNNSGNFALEQMLYYTRRASTIGSDTIYGTDPGKLVLTSNTNPTVTIDTYQTSVALGETIVPITKLRLQHGSATPIDITSDRVHVASFILANLTSDTLPTVQITLHLEAANPSNSVFYEAEKTFVTSATLRIQ
ncbi:MAG TPA: hypothetical protein DCY48_00570 [Candidatus Magasanikbacteria bacterium]|nr:MAG: hypothetical protein A3I74_02530 [Candidatus Magasanikbacteria bacterium RIFCSPLOWO2_02_FULL_47_16]OGH79618.1 MAG: hypothetical protein A3C10_00870 [Candidatus Magasanikbacteria bacterium RIFCSPHIGHO2_02_FULL_48_18]OGH82034.1 MAG: hypothetical protein A3G08_02380 [Candidatus Magasanikbacteria bacterium RIFCSPLOWO2_12_FULL_47_9b]HAZ28257.1 hypothetical protein [Candidatus Magasanikbacteria bacterium]